MAYITEKLKDLINARLEEINDTINLRMGGEDSERFYKVFIQTEEDTPRKAVFYTDMFINDEFGNTRWVLCKFDDEDGTTAVSEYTLTLPNMDILLSKIVITIKSIDDDETHRHVEHVLRFEPVYTK